MKKFALVCVLGVVVLAGCKSVEGTTVEEKRGNVLKMRDAALDDLYKEKAAAKAEIADAAGYAVFTNVGINLFVVASGNGYGVVTNSKTDKVTYMNMREVGVGIGMGAKDFRAIFIFKDAKVMDGSSRAAGTSAATRMPRPSPRTAVMLRPARSQRRA